MRYEYVPITNEVSLHDSTISMIKRVNNEITFVFDDNGYLRRNHSEESFCKATNATMIIRLIDDESIDIKVTNSRYVFRRFIIGKPIEFVTLIEKVNSKQWRLEIINTFFSGNSAMLYCMLYHRDTCYNLYLRFQFKSIVYDYD